MNWEYGVLVGVVGFIAYQIGYHRGLVMAAKLASRMLSEIDNDLNGAVSKWFDGKVEGVKRVS